MLHCRNASFYSFYSDYRTATRRLETSLVRFWTIEGCKANVKVPFTLLRVDERLKLFWKRYFKTIKEDRTQENSAKVGTYLMTELAKLRDKYEIIGDVRGKGLQIGVEMVKAKVGRDPLPSQAMAQIFEDTKDMGVLIGKGGLYRQTFRIQPPMCITKDDADFFLTVLNQAVLKNTQ